MVALNLMVLRLTEAQQITTNMRQIHSKSVS